MPPQPLAIVGVGASAGGLEAFTALLESVPRDLDVAWVLVQHLDPTQDSMMAELLGRHSTIPVTEARPDEPVQPGHVYVIPPDRFLSVDGDTLRLARPAVERGKRMAVDYLFRSLAEAFGRRAIGVVLSGTGGDGTHGLRAIKAAGGLTIAQDPETAAYDGMPRSAIEARAADLTLPVDEIAGAVVSFLKHPYMREHEPTPTTKDGAQADRDEVVSESDREQLGGVLEVLHNELGLDLSTYKLSTLGRRVQRRMGLTHVTSMAEYRKRLSHDRQELHELARDVHVSVTDFFRDPEAFESLTKSALPKLFEQAATRPSGERSIRVWVPGCATGEEAYSIAIALHELRRERWPDSGIGIQIFATDVDTQAIRVARMGVYPDACMTNVSEQRRTQWFQQLDTPGQYRVRQHLRDSLSFAEHNVLSDPPFSKLDLISCRNLLIYLQRSAQERVLTTFHFALESQGFLLLGPSEALGTASDSFRVVDKKWRL
ncbi:MAG: chemotaxis protein CheB, partial [Phycisphaerales bacterium JB064]